MQNTTSQILYKYWNEIRGGRMAPRRFEIEPARFTAILPETFMVECEPGEVPRFRLTGTRVTEKLGVELRGHAFSDLFDAADEADLKPFLASIVNQGGVGVITIERTTPSGRNAVFEVLVLPLIHTAERVTRLLGTISARTHEPWLGSETTRPGRILERGVIWPEGRPHAVAERMAPPPAQSPFKYDFSRSRLVRLRRRQFRVYEGGR
ncbi:MAG TPA: PAS domain-containing protein [Hyphomicrobiaceae bacterium]|nr:PAS domain-containing protein [Hyphomicrobiaceae bacterium]